MLGRVAALRGCSVYVRFEHLLGRTDSEADSIYDM